MHLPSRHLSLLSLHAPQDRLVNLFETTIRVLGGLQSAFAMTPGGDRLLLLKVLVAVTFSVKLMLSLQLSAPRTSTHIHKEAVHGALTMPFRSCLVRLETIAHCCT